MIDKEQVKNYAYIRDNSYDSLMQGSSPKSSYFKAPGVGDDIRNADAIATSAIKIMSELSTMNNDRERAEANYILDNILETMTGETKEYIKRNRTSLLKIYFGVDEKKSALSQFGDAFSIYSLENKKADFVIERNKTDNKIYERELTEQINTLNNQIIKKSDIFYQDRTWLGKVISKTADTTPQILSDFVIIFIVALAITAVKGTTIKKIWKVDKHNNSIKKTMSMNKALRVLLSIVTIIVEYFMIFGVPGVIIGKTLMEVSMIVYWIFLIGFIALAIFSWRKIVPHKDKNSEET